MELFIKANRVSRYNLRMLYENIRIPIAIFVAMIYVMESLTDIASFSSIVNVKVTPYAFVFVINNYRVQFIIAACAIIIFGNAPYENETYRYMVSRSGKTAWGLGQVIYIIKMTLIYVAGIFAASIIPYITRIDFSGEWGKIWGTLGKTNAGTQYGIQLAVSPNIIANYTPLLALVISIILEFCSVLWLGLVIYWGNKITGKGVGTVIGIILSVLDVCIANDWMGYAYKFSPMSLSQLELYYGYAAKWGLNLGYTFRFFSITLIGLGTLCIVSNHKGKLVKRFKNGK